MRELTTSKAGRADNPILSAKMVASLFQPELTEKGVASLERLIGVPNSQWGIGLCLNCDNYPGRRRKGSGYCTFAVHHSMSTIYTKSK